MAGPHYAVDDIDSKKKDVLSRWQELKEALVRHETSNLVRYIRLTFSFWSFTRFTEIHFNQMWLRCTLSGHSSQCTIGQRDYFLAGDKPNQSKYVGNVHLKH